jgi:colanic acid biosynthesis glycosyl transferase WcaI
VRVVVNDYAGHPFQLQLSEELARRGHKVTHQYCANNVTPHADFDAAAVEVEPLDTGGVFEKYRILLRVRDELRYGRLAARAVRRHRPEVVLASNMPVLSLLVLWVACRMVRARRVLWLQDIQSGLAAQKLGGGLARLPVRLFESLEWFAIRRSTGIVTISHAFTETVAARTGNRVPVTEVENWAVLDAITLDEGRSEVREAMALRSEFLFVYSGTLGIKHRPEVLAELARQGRGVCDVLVVSEGPAVEELRLLGLENLHILPFQPFERVGSTLAAADALVVLLEPDAGGFSVPSKLLTYLCAGRAIVAAAPVANAASLIVNERARCGFAVESAAEFVKQALDLVANPSTAVLQGRNARSYAESNFDVSEIAERFERSLL